MRKVGKENQKGEKSDNRARNKKILINARYSEEKRVAIIENDRLVDFYVEVSAKEQLKGNIYKAVVVRIEPGIQAAFVDFGPKKHGFLQIREISQEYVTKTKGGKRPKIQDALKRGQELIVQVERDERDTKGASVTTYISIPGRYIVMMPGQERVSISRKIEGQQERQRLKDLFVSLKPPQDMGFILRTACSDRTAEELGQDLKYLTKLWGKIQDESSKAKAPSLIYKEQDIAVRTVRDYLTSDVTEVLIDEDDAYKRTKEFLRKTLPWRKINIKLYRDKRPIFAHYNLEEQVGRIYDRYVYLPCGGYLVFDKTEALTSIDVNSGKSRKEEGVELTAFKTNLEAAEEIARQLRLRDIGGLIVVDFIDMASQKHRKEVEQVLKEALKADKANAEMSGMSQFGMIEMTRERMRPAYSEAVTRRCEHCGGTGSFKADELVAISALRDIHKKAAAGSVSALTCRLPVGCANYLINSKRGDLWSIEKAFDVSVNVIADPTLVSGQHTIETESVENPDPGVPKPAEEAT